MGVWLDLDLDKRPARVDKRVNDVSDATRDVLKAQMEKPTGHMEWLQIDAAKDTAIIAAQIRKAFESRHALPSRE